jgi:hypothetical protein
MLRAARVHQSVKVCIAFDVLSRTQRLTPASFILSLHCCSRLSHDARLSGAVNMKEACDDDAGFVPYEVANEWRRRNL